MINHLRDGFGVEPVCRELNLSASAYNARRRRPKSARQRRDDHLVAEIRRIHTDSSETYGARRIHRQLRREGITAARCTTGWPSGPRSASKTGQTDPGGMDESSPAVVLRPPLAVMRPRPADEIPEQDSMPGGLQHSLKLDGFRALAFILESGRAFLQSRSGRDLSREFPQVSAYLQEYLLPGIVLDSELCAYCDGRLSFTDLLRSGADREKSGIPVYYIAFDILAVPGKDVRACPLQRDGRFSAELWPTPSRPSSVSWPHWTKRPHASGFAR